MSVDASEGVIKFQLDHEVMTLEALEANDVAEINAWRTVFNQTGTIGQVADRYDGYGFGNLSQKTASGFLISGTQTGFLESTSIADYSEVTRWDSRKNSVSSRGQVSPSSESLTHAVIYEACPEVVAVFHLHSPDIWHGGAELNIPTTSPEIEYGTPEMAEAVYQCVRGSPLPGILSMGGHEDGIMAYGRTLNETGLLLIRYLVEARRLQAEG
jgi:L-ribulose-5-phosphate 4-epimerase